jgi:hypothetical protein
MQLPKVLESLEGKGTGSFVIGGEKFMTIGCDPNNTLRGKKGRRAPACMLPLNVSRGTEKARSFSTCRPYKSACTLSRTCRAHSMASVRRLQRHVHAAISCTGHVLAGWLCGGELSRMRGCSG